MPVDERALARKHSSGRNTLDTDQAQTRGEKGLHAVVDTYADSLMELRLDERANLVDVSIVVPAFNEEAAIAGAMQDLHAALEQVPWRYEVIVVDDGCSDNTVCQAQTVPGLKVVSHGRNRGYGAALKTGIREARGEVIIIMDADGTYPAHFIPQLVSELSDCDMVVGSRTGAISKIPAIRRPAKWFLNRLASFLAETEIPDLNSGLRAFRKQAVLPFFGILPSGFSFTTTITLSMLCNDYRVKYVPIDYEQRVGRSKIKPLQDTYKFIMLVLRTVCLFNPLKVFLPPAFILILLGLARLAYNAVTIHHVAGTELLFIISGFQLGAIALLADMVSKMRAVPRTEAHPPEPMLL